MLTGFNNHCIVLHQECVAEAYIKSVWCFIFVCIVHVCICTTKLSNDIINNFFMQILLNQLYNLLAVIILLTV